MYMLHYGVDRKEKSKEKLDWEKVDISGLEVFDKAYLKYDNLPKSAFIDIVVLVYPYKFQEGLKKIDKSFIQYFEDENPEHEIHLFQVDYFVENKDDSVDGLEKKGKSQLKHNLWCAEYENIEGLKFNRYGNSSDGWYDFELDNVFKVMEEGLSPKV